jgi:hypothetical protein
MRDAESLVVTAVTVVTRNARRVAIDISYSVDQSLTGNDGMRSPARIEAARDAGAQTGAREKNVDERPFF